MLEVRQSEEEARRTEERRAVELQQREEAASLAEEQARAAAAEAALTPEDRLLRDLRAQFGRATPDDKKPGGPLASALNIALQDSAIWPSDQRARLADLTEAVCNVVGWGKAEKKAEKKERLAKLRG